MTESQASPLSHLTADQLHRLLGHAWTAQLRPQEGSFYYLSSPLEMGQQQFATIALQLRADLAHPHSNAAAVCVASTIERHAAWPMPHLLITELADRLGYFATAADRLPDQSASTLSSVCSISSMPPLHG